MASNQSAFVEKYIKLRQDNGKPEELTEYFTPGGKIIDNVTNMKTYQGKDELLEYYKSSVKPWVSPSVSSPVENPDGTFTVTLTFSTFGYTVKTVTINFKFVTDELLFDCVILD